MKIQNFAGLALLMGTLMSVPAEAGYGRVAVNGAPAVVFPAVPDFTAGGLQVVRPGVPAVPGVAIGGIGVPVVRPSVPVAGRVNGAIGLETVNPHDVANRHFESAVKVPTVGGCDPNFQQCQ